MTDNKKDIFSYPLFIFQLVAAPMGGLFFGLAAEEFFDLWSGTRGNQFGGLLCYALVGFTQGLLTQTVFRRSACSGGRFVWVPPACVITVLLFFGDSRDLDKMLVMNPYSFDQGGVWALLTGPAFASCLYSLGIILAHRVWRDRRQI